MQTDSIQKKSLYDTGAPPKSAPLPDVDFKQALSRQMERQPAPPAPEPAAQAQPTPAKQPQKQAQPKPANQTSQPKPAQQAKPTQQNQQTDKADKANQADQAADADTAKDACAAAETAATTPATQADASTAGKGDAATEEAAAAAAADPMANMLAMVAAYQQLSTGKADAAATTPADGTDAAALAAAQGDAAGKRAAAGDLTAAAGKHGETAALQQAPGDQADAALLAKLTGGAERAGAGTDAKAEAFAAKLAESTTAPQPVLPQGAQALAATAQAANAVVANQLQARVGSNAWEQQLGQKVVWMVAGGDQSASLTLNPPDLGPLQVVLNVSNDQATATFTAHQPETRQAIENALPKLREMMSEAGIQLGNASVSAGTQDQQQAFAEQASRGHGGSGGGRYGDAAGGDEPSPQPIVRRTVLGAVDTFA